VRIRLPIPKIEYRIYVLLAAFVALSALYSILVPPFEASDELWHYPMVKTIADNWALPVQDPENIGPWRQEGSQPPLYYFIAAVATSWIDTTDVGVVRHLNPHVDGGVATADGNINLVTHHPDAESFPWRGTALALHLMRFMSVLMSAATVYLTYRLSLELVPNRQNLALFAAAVNAFTPMFIFISGAVNNDNLVVPLCSLALLLMVRIVKRTTDERRRTSDDSRSTPVGRATPPRGTHHLARFTSLGLVVGLALLTKESAGGLILLTALTVAYVAWRERSPRTFLVGALASAVPTLLISGWWYWRNWRLYGDPTGQNVFIKVLGQRDVPADLAQLWRERISFIRGYWGNFGGLNVPMAEWVYTALDVLLLLAILGLIVAIARNLKSVNRRDVRFWPWLIALLWPLLVVVPWITWATMTWSSQGRLIFSAISVWSLLLALGWDSLARLLPKKLRSAASVAIPLFLFIISLVAPYAWIRPAYALPPALTDAQIAAISNRVNATFFHPAGGQLKLLGYETPVQVAIPGQTVPVTLYWEAIEPFARDYSIFVHLVDDQDLLTAQRDAFPAMGTLSTQWLTPGNYWSEQRHLTLPDTAFGPNQTVFEVGLYDFATGERLAVVDAGGQIAGDHVRFGQLEVQPRPGEVPNPITIDFGGEIELVGYDLDRRALRRPDPTTDPSAEPATTLQQSSAESSAASTATLTLYWRAQRPMDVNYSISTQFVNETGVKAAQKDAWPFDGAAPTSLWEPGRLIEEPRELVIFDDTPPGVYDVYVAVYPSDDPDSLLVVTPSGGRLQTDHVVLTTIRVLP
jgi:4-amino-4-deoxy-L-arabinose transferase-like glycosyltransferase